METQTSSAGDATTPWVMLGSAKDDADPGDAGGIAAAVGAIIDEWHSKGRIMWSGALGDGRSGMAVFEATRGDAEDLFQRYRDACGSSLNCFLYEWDAMPILSLLSGAPQAVQAR